MGNICRSPAAEGLLRDKLTKKGLVEGKDFIIDSAGTISAWEGSAPDDRSVDIMKRNNIDIFDQASRPLTPEDGGKFDLIFCMDENNARSAKEILPAKYHDKIQLFDVTSVGDPYSSGATGFEDMFQQLNGAADKIVTELFG